MHFLPHLPGIKIIAGSRWPWHHREHIGLAMVLQQKKDGLERVLRDRIPVKIRACFVVLTW